MTTVVLDNVIQSAYTRLTDEIATHFSDVTVVNMPDGDPVPPLDEIDAVLITGSSAGVYEDTEHPWIAAERDLVTELVERETPILGICFGHQLVNDALGGTVEAQTLTAGLVRGEFEDDPLFDCVDPVVPVLHGDYVVERGADMERIGTAPHCRNLATRHRSAPVWTVQFHPELTPRIVDEQVRPTFGWESNGLSYAESTAILTIINFRRLLG
jgi:GMP synthase (glutamine-hydrolysing)